MLYAMKYRALNLLAFLALAALARVAVAAEPLYLREPFDEITLDEKNDHAVLQVRPLELGGPPRRVPESPEGKISVRLLDQPEKAYEVDWAAIAKVTLFEDRVLQVAKQLVSKGKFDEAYEHLQFLRKNYPKLEGLEPAYDDYLFEEAKVATRDKRFDNALAMLRELYERNPKRPELQGALVMTSEKLIEKLVAAEDYPGARLLVRNLQSWFPKEPAVAKWQSQFQTQAGTLLKQAQAALAAGEFRKADEAARRMQQLWPQLAGAKELCAAVHAKYGRVVVGITSTTSLADPGRIDDWAARRTGCLVQRPLVMFAGPGAQGGNYQCPVGTLNLDKSLRKMTLTVTPDLRWSAGTATLTGADVAHRLLAMADPADASYQAGWGELLGGIEVSAIYNVAITFRHPCVRPEAWLQTYLLPYTNPSLLDQPDLSSGPYMVHSKGEDETRYVVNDRDGGGAASRPREIAERYFREKGKALSALRQGRIQIIDRLAPWEVQVARGARGLVVEPYAAPLVHCLVPNLRKPLTANRTFRRALVYGLDRAGLLDTLCGGRELPGARVISGPFAATLGSDRSIHYAYDDMIKPREYDPRLGLMLAAQAAEEVSPAEKARGREFKGLSLLLAHPGDPVARLACSTIRQQLQLVGIAVSLKELAPGASCRVTDDVDLVYAELAAWEPVVDARRILGEDGLAGGCSPYMSLALRQLESASDWGEVRSRMRQIHRVAHQEVALVPLYQLTDHFAYHESIQGIGTRPVTLYQNVQQWQAGFSYSGDQQ
jgi:ABC-type transport system substrate-binding protein/Flp pilus assembly protein TadD